MTANKTTGEKNKSIADLKILLVEDQADVRAMIRDILSDLKITQIFEAKDGREALDFMDAAFDFADIIVCDWNMPAMSGVEFLRQIRSVSPDIPFLMVTGRADMDSVVEAKSSGVNGYISKPFSPAQFEAKLTIVATKAGLI